MEQASGQDLLSSRVWFRCRVMGHVIDWPSKERQATGAEATESRAPTWVTTLIRPVRAQVSSAVQFVSRKEDWAIDNQSRYLDIIRICPLILSYEYHCSAMNTFSTFSTEITLDRVKVENTDFITDPK